MPKRPFVLPSRQIHLDFHTSPLIGDIGVDFDAREFARTMKRAHVNSVTVFAKCHHGHLYYRTKRPERHPGLSPRLDLLGRQIEALHREGIRAPIYISVQIDEYAVHAHPEWIVRNPDGKDAGAAPFAPGWRVLDMNSEYQEYLAEQTAEILKTFKPFDGIFFDMCWDQPSCSEAALAAMQAKRLDPEKDEDRRRHGHEVALAYMRRFHGMVKAATPDATVFFNSRPLNNLTEELGFLEQVEIEALPSGFWGYMYFPTNVRYARTFGKPYMGMTGRFHRDWGDFGGMKPYAALEYETSQMAAQGAASSVGDQLHPRGRLDPAVYELIGKAYGRLAEREPWLTGAAAETEVAVLRAAPGTASAYLPSGVEDGATRMLTLRRHQFDILESQQDFAAYRLVVLPDALPVDARLAKRLRAYLKRGGRVLASGTSGLDPEATTVALPELAIAPAGKSPFTTSYVRFGREIAAGVPDTVHAMYERSVRVRPTSRGRSVAAVAEPYFERTWKHFCSHRQTPDDRVSRWSAAVLTARTGYVAYPAFSAFAAHANYPLRLLVGALMARLLPDQLLRAGGPTGLEASVMRQRVGRSERTIVHLLYYSPERRGKDLDLVEDIVPLRDVPISLRAEQAPKRVYLAPSGRELEFAHRDGRIEIVVPEVVGHAMVVVE